MKCPIKIHPVPGQDAQWIGYCPKCDDSELHVSRGGMKLGGVQHCYGCGHERELTGISQKDIDRMVLSDALHWRKYPLLPYNWHTLSEEVKWQVLGMKG